MISPKPAAFIVLSGCLLPGCNVGPSFKRPETKVDAKFSGQKQGGFKSEQTIVGWWRKFNDSQLNSLVSRSLANNPDLKIAAARVDEARALRNEVRLDYYPTVRSAAGYSNDKRSLAQTGGVPFGPRSLEIYSAGFEAAWELDLWGRVRRKNRAARADVATAEAVRHDTMVILTSEVAGSYLELRGLQHQLDVARRNAENTRETLKLTEALLQGGRGTELDTSRARAQLNGTLAAIPNIESGINRSIHRIAVLAGAQPASLEAELNKPKAMPSLPSPVRIGDPAGLLRRRPDVEAAEKSLEAATERIGVAVADLFPRVSFNGYAAVQSNALSGPASANTGFGPNIVWAAFDIGRVQAQIDAAGARARGQLASYQKTVLTALQETEDALFDYGRKRARRDYLGEAAKASEQAAKLALERYQNGVADFLTVLDAQRTLLLAQSELAESETLTAISVVAIYKALGGGWQGR